MGCDNGKGETGVEGRKQRRGEGMGKEGQPSKFCLKTTNQNLICCMIIKKTLDL